MLPGRSPRLEGGWSNRFPPSPSFLNSTEFVPLAWTIIRSGVDVVQTIDILVSPAEQEAIDQLKRAAGRHLGLSADRIDGLRVLRRSIDARRRPVLMTLRLEVFVDEPAPEQEQPIPEYEEVTSDRRMIVVGSGPAGLFAALRLIERNVRPIIVERGKDVQSRRRDLAGVTKRGTVNPDSNYCFGEGGAGTYSDGKLYTRSTKRGDVASVYRTLVAHGATPDILVDAHPHIGSNRLPKVVAAIRESILGAGGEIHFNERVDRLVRRADGRLVGVGTTTGNEFTGEGVVLATGHSARDIFRMLHADGIRIEPKPFAVGVRLEHPQPLIDRIQYHEPKRPEGLPAARYRLAHTVEDRGVFSFCMCPGGFIVPAATEQDEVVVNGMSLSRRDSPFANSGIIVNIEPEADLDLSGPDGPLAGIAFQKRLEVASAQAGGGMQKAAAQRMTDFVVRKTSGDLPDSSYHPGTTPYDLHELLGEGLAGRLATGLSAFGQKMRGYMTEEAILIAVESRTSSPVRIPRDRESLMHPEVPGLYPSGEGAGYAGGIVSAALDGLRIAERAAAERVIDPSA